MEGTDQLAVFKLFAHLEETNSVIELVTDNTCKGRLFLALLTEDCCMSDSQFLPVFDTDAGCKSKGFLVILKLELDLTKLFSFAKLHINLGSLL